MGERGSGRRREEASELEWRRESVGGRRGKKEGCFGAEKSAVSSGFGIVVVVVNGPGAREGIEVNYTVMYGHALLSPQGLTALAKGHAPTKSARAPPVAKNQHRSQSDHRDGA